MCMLPPGRRPRGRSRPSPVNVGPSVSSLRRVRSSRSFSNFVSCLGCSREVARDHGTQRKTMAPRNASTTRTGSCGVEGSSPANRPAHRPRLATRGSRGASRRDGTHNVNTAPRPLSRRARYGRVSPGRGAARDLAFPPPPNPRRVSPTLCPSWPPQARQRAGRRPHKSSARLPPSGALTREPTTRRERLRSTERTRHP